MSADHLSEDHVVSPCGIGFVTMAWALANERAYRDGTALALDYLRRREPVYPVESANFWYYRIIDCVTRGHQWRAEKEFASCERCHNVKAMRDFGPGEFNGR